MILNAFFRNANAAQNIQGLFGTSASTSTSTSSLLDTSSTTTSSALEFDTSGQKALAKIISILAGLDESGSGSGPQVDEQGGNILSATGTDKGEDFSFKLEGVFNVDAGGGSDTMTIKATAASNIGGGDGNDVMNIATSTLTDVFGGAGDDVVNFTGRFAKDINGDDGNDTLRISAATIMYVDGGSGDDTIALEGKRIIAAGGTGNDAISIKNTGEEAATLAFARGDGQDTVTSNGPLDIRLGTMTGSNGGYSPAELTVTTTTNGLTIKANDATDAISIRFDAGSLASATPNYSFSMEDGAWVLQIR
jgi:hypothetical protein